MTQPKGRGGKKDKMLIQATEKIGNLQGENVWIEILEVRESPEWGIMAKVILRNNPVLDKTLHYGDIVYAIRGKAPIDRWIMLKVDKSKQ
jgi:hypothetical protein